MDEFIQSTSLHDERDTFLKGALIAQNPSIEASVPEITDAERQILKEEIEQKWKQPVALWLTIATCSIGAAVHGWDQVSVLLYIKNVKN